MFQAEASKLSTIVNEMMKHNIILWKFNEEIGLIGWSQYVSLVPQIRLAPQIAFSLGIMDALCALSLCIALFVSANDRSQCINVAH